MPTVVPPADYDQYDWSLAESKGYLEDVVVDLAGGRRVTVTFYDPVRLAQDIEAEMSEGITSISWKRLIVVEKITIAALQAAVDAAPSAFFD